MNHDLQQRCDDIINELRKFHIDLLDLDNSITDDRLDKFEKEIGYKLPLDFRYILTKHNGITLYGTQIYGLDDKFRGASLDEIYRFEHKELTENAMPIHFLPFSPDGYGNHYCLNLLMLSNEICPVVFWQHDYPYDTLDEVEVCNADIIDWIKEVMIDWTLEEYNYNGTEK